MKDLLRRLNYKGQKRIALLNTPQYYIDFFLELFDNDVEIDKKIDLRYPYDFMIVFADSAGEIKSLTPSLLHNLVYDGIIWCCFPAKKKRGLSLNRGWKSLFDAGLSKKKVVTIDENRLAIEFKNPGFGE